MGKPDAPEPPSPKQTAAAQTGTNIGTAIANNTMGMMGQNTPYGSISYEQTGTQTWKDPFTGKVYKLPQYTANTTLTPAEQAILNENTGARTNLASLANERSAFLKDYLANSGSMTDAIDEKLYSLGASRLDPRFAQEQSTLETALANKGITAGSEAYNREMDRLSQSKNDAYNQLLLTGRGQAANEVNMPINQITALLSGSQVQNPNVSMYQPQGVPTTDVAGLINNNYNQRSANYQQQMASRNSLLGGLFGLGAGFI